MTILEEELIPAAWFIFWVEGSGTFLPKRKAIEATASKARTQGIIIAIIPPVDKPEFFFL